MKKIKISFITYLYVFLLLYSGLKRELLYFLIIFTIHELGHIFFIVISKNKIINITVYPFGGIIKIDKKLNSPVNDDLLVASGGLIFQVILYIVLIIFIGNPTLERFNLYVLLLNILPVIPFDGSKIIFNIISKHISYYYSLVLYFIISIISLFGILLVLIINSYNNYLLITFLVFSLIGELKLFNIAFYTFIIERYLYGFNYKKIKYYRKNTLKKLQREIEGYFDDNKWENEREIIAKKFDISSYIW